MTDPERKIKPELDDCEAIDLLGSQLLGIINSDTYVTQKCVKSPRKSRNLQSWNKFPFCANFNENYIQEEKVSPKTLDFTRFGKNMHDQSTFPINIDYYLHPSSQVEEAGLSNGIWPVEEYQNHHSRENSYWKSKLSYMEETQDEFKTDFKKNLKEGFKSSISSEEIKSEMFDFCLQTRNTPSNNHIYKFKRIDHFKQVDQLDKLYRLKRLESPIVGAEQTVLERKNNWPKDNGKGGQNLDMLLNNNFLEEFEKIAVTPKEISIGDFNKSRNCFSTNFKERNFLAETPLNIEEERRTNGVVCLENEPQVSFQKMGQTRSDLSRNVKFHDEVPISFQKPENRNDPFPKKLQRPFQVVEQRDLNFQTGVYGKQKESKSSKDSLEHQRKINQRDSKDQKEQNEGDRANLRRNCFEWKATKESRFDNREIKHEREKHSHERDTKVENAENVESNKSKNSRQVKDAKDFRRGKEVKENKTHRKNLGSFQSKKKDDIGRKKSNREDNIRRGEKKKIIFAKGFSNLVVDDSESSYEEEEVDEVCYNQNHIEIAAKSNSKPTQNLPRKKEANSALWNFDESTEKDNIKNFWHSLSPGMRQQFVDIPKNLIVSVLAKQFKISCVCGKCHKRETYVYNKLSQLYDRFYSDLRIVDQDDSVPPKDFRFACLDDERMSLRIRLSSDDIDVDLLNKSNKCFVNRFSHFLCESIRKNSERSKHKDYEGNEGLYNEEENFSEEEDENEHQNRAQNDLKEEHSESELENTTQEEFEAFNAHENAIEHNELNSHVFPQLSETLKTSESDENCKQSSMAEEEHFNYFQTMKALQPSLQTSQAPRTQRFGERLRNEAIVSNFREFLNFDISEKNRAFLNKIIKAYRTGTYEQTKQILVQFFASYIPENLIDFEHMSFRIDDLLWSVNKAFRLLENVKIKHDNAQLKMEEEHSQQIDLLKKQYKIAETEYTSEESQTQSHYLHLNLRQKQLEEQQNQLRRQYSEQKSLHRQVFGQLKQIFETKIFVAPLDVLRPEVKLKIISEFKYFTCIDKNIYDTLTAIEYGPLIEACLPPSQPSADFAEVESEEEFSDEYDNESVEDDFVIDKYDECVKMFKCFAVKMFYQRVLKAYLELVSEKKQQALLDEEEEEKQIDMIRRQKKKEKRSRYKKRAKQKTKGKKD